MKLPSLTLLVIAGLLGITGAILKKHGVINEVTLWITLAVVCALCVYLEGLKKRS